MARWGYSGTRRCRRCGNTGHNRRTCPHNSAYAKEQYKTTHARKCSWCKQSGHNKATCERRKEDRAIYIKDNAAYRQNALAALIAAGCGPGALVKRYGSAGTDENPDCYMIVKEIQWEGIQSKKKYARVVYGEVLGEHEWVACMQIPWEALDGDGDGVVSGVPESVVRHGMPISWLNGTSGIDEFF